jgi:hypothetical protein
LAIHLIDILSFFSELSFFIHFPSFWKSHLNLNFEWNIYMTGRYVGFAIERQNIGGNIVEDQLQASVCLIQSILLGSFAVMLGAHRSEIIDRNSNLHTNTTTDGESSVELEESKYDPPTMK